MTHILSKVNSRTKIRKCFRCRKEFENGDEIVRVTSSHVSNKFRVRHRSCYTDAKGEPLL